MRLSTVKGTYSVPLFIMETIMESLSFSTPTTRKLRPPTVMN